MATIKKVVAKKPLPKAQLGPIVKGVVKAISTGAKAARGPKFKDPSPKPTKDSTNYYTGKETFYRKASNNLIENKNPNKPNDNGDAITKANKMSMDAFYDLKRQKLKGIPGYDANGFPVKYKKGGAIKSKTKKK